MDNDLAADLYEEDAAQLLTWVRDADPTAATINGCPKEWIEEQVASQLTNANLARRNG